VLGENDVLRDSKYPEKAREKLSDLEEAAVIHSKLGTGYSLPMSRVPRRTGSADISSELSKFYRLPIAKRRVLVRELAGLSDEELRVLTGDEGLCAEQANHMVENALGVIGLPLALCINLRINDRDWLVPMGIEEASVVAAASHAAKLLRAGSGIRAEVSPAHMIGQIQVLDVPDPDRAGAAVLAAKAGLLESASSLDPCLVRAGGGAVDLEVRHLPQLDPTDPVGAMLVVHLVVDVREAMGANTVNSMCEHLAPRIEELTGGRVRLRIISNLADRRIVTATGVVPLRALEGKGCTSPEALARGIEEASVFAERDPYRAATHNKGIMNGIDAVLVAFGQDWRAVEAGAHAYAARDGRYSALARWRVVGDELVGRLELPMPVGMVGGVTRVHPTTRVARKVAQITTCAELASVTAAVGLAQNLGALRALAAEGIQRGHMRAHARNVAVAAGAVEYEVDQVASAIADRGQVTVEAARDALRTMRDHAPVAVDSVQLRQRFESLKEAHLPAILELIEQLIQRGTPDGSTLCEMCIYHLRTGGKRLRALLPLMVADALGVDPDQLVPFGAACEMLHNATLVHDDLQDGDRTRRGQETVWSHYGTPQAINLGDAMFYYTLLLVHRLNVPLARREAAARRVLKETLRVIDGQEREFALKQAQSPTLEDYFAMVEGKTSGLFALPMAGAAALCGTATEIVDGLQEAARHMGVLFQIQDDVLDLYGNKGRDHRGSDIEEGKRSILVVHALQTAPEAEARWLREILDKPREATTAEEVDAAIDFFARNGSLAFALAEITRRQGRTRQVAAELGHEPLVAVVEAMCDLFLEPIQPVLAKGTA
jgi:hydroxymethylglutaryl-CoA reductase